MHPTCVLPALLLFACGSFYLFLLASVIVHRLLLFFPFSVPGNFPLLFLFSFFCCRIFGSFVAVVWCVYYVMVVPLKWTADPGASSSSAVSVGGRQKCRHLDGLSVLPQYVDCGDCTWVCEFCDAFFWYLREPFIYLQFLIRSILIVVGLEVFYFHTRLGFLLDLLPCIEVRIS